MAPVFISVTRTAQCFFCSKQWTLDYLEYPKKCVWCGSRDWEFGPASSDTKLIRMGITRLRKSLNPGAKSRNRQIRGKSQWRRFKNKDGENV